MEEKERMLKGELYSPNKSSILLNEMKRAKELCFKYNSIDLYSEIKNEIIEELFGHIGKGFHIEPYFWCDYGYNIFAGENLYINHNCVILDGARVEFGDNVFVAPNCGFYTAGHPINIDERNSGLEYAKPIKIGNNVWIGGNVVVLPGVTIGDNVTIGAGSVVNKDIPSNVVAVGNPCKVCKEL